MRSKNDVKFSRRSRRRRCWCRAGPRAAPRPAAGPGGKTLEQITFFIKNKSSNPKIQTNPPQEPGPAAVAPAGREEEPAEAQEPRQEEEQERRQEEQEQERRQEGRPQVSISNRFV